MAKKIFYGIEIVGIKTTIDDLARLELQQAALTNQIKEAKKTANTDVYTNLRKQQESLKIETANLRKELRQQQLEFEKSKYPVDSLIGIEQAYSRLRAEIRKMTAEQRNSAEGIAKVNQAAALKDQILKIDGSIKDFRSNIGNYQSAFQGITVAIGGAVGETFGSLFQSIENYNNSITTGLPRTLAFGAAIAAFGSQLQAGAEKAIEYDAAVKDMQAITGVTGEAFKRFELAAAGLKNITIGGQSIQTDGAKIIETMKLIGSQQPELLTQPDKLADAAKNIILLAKANNISVADAAETTLSTMAAFGTSVNDSAKIINTLSAGSQAGAAELKDLSVSFKNVGVVAGSFGVTVEESTAALETLAARGLKGAEAGTALRTVFDKMAAAKILPPDAQQVFQKAGIDINILSDKTQTLERRFQELAKIGSNAAAANLIFGDTGKSAALIISQSIPTYTGLVKSVTDTGAAYKQAEINASSLKTRAENLTVAYNEFLITAFNTIQKVLVPVGEAFLSIGSTIAQLPRFFKENEISIYSLVAAFTALNYQSLISIANTAKNTVVVGLNTIAQRLNAQAARFSASSQALETVSESANTAATVANTAALAANTGVTVGNTAATTVGAAAQGAWTAAVTLARGAMSAFNATILANPIGALVAGLVLVGGAVASFVKGQREAATETNRLSDAYYEQEKVILTNQARMNDLFNSLKDTNKSTDERRKIIDELNNNYKSYLPNLLTEKSTIDEITKAQNGANAAFLKELEILSLKDKIKTKTDKRVELLLDIQKAEKAISNVSNDFKDTPDFLDLGSSGGTTVAEVRASQITAGLGVLRKELNAVDKEINEFLELGKKSGIDLNAKATVTKTQTVTTPEKDILPDKKSDKKTEKDKGLDDYERRLEAQLKRIEEAEKILRSINAAEIINEFDKQLVEAENKYTDELSKIAARRKELSEKIEEDKKFLKSKYKRTEKDNRETELINQEEQAIKLQLERQKNEIEKKRNEAFEAAKEQIRKQASELVNLRVQNAIEETKSLLDATGNNKKQLERAALDINYKFDVVGLQEQYRLGELNYSEFTKRKKEIDEQYYKNVKTIENEISALKLSGADIAYKVRLRQIEAEKNAALNAANDELTARRKEIEERLKLGKVTPEQGEKLREQAAFAFVERRKAANLKAISETENAEIEKVKNISAANAELSQQEFEAHLRRLAQLDEEEERVRQLRAAAVDTAKAASDAIFRYQSDSENRKKEKELANLEENAAKSLALVAGNATAEAAVKKQLEAEKEKIARDSFEKQKQRDIGQATVDGLLAILKAFATSDPITATATAFYIGAQTAIAVAEIAGRKFAGGGYTGKSNQQRDETGQRPVGIVHEKEFVITRPTLEQNPDLIPFLDSLNAGVSPNKAMQDFIDAPTGQIPYKIFQTSPALQAAANNYGITSEQIDKIGRAVESGATAGAIAAAETQRRAEYRRRRAEQSSIL